MRRIIIYKDKNYENVKKNLNKTIWEKRIKKLISVNFCFAVQYSEYRNSICVLFHIDLLILANKEVNFFQFVYSFIFKLRLYIIISI